MIYLTHHEDDDQPDGYLNRADMTVFGYGRLEKEKYLDTPQTFSIGFVESTDYYKVEPFIKEILNTPTPERIRSRGQIPERAHSRAFEFKLRAATRGIL